MSGVDSRPPPYLPELEAEYELVRELGGGATSVVYLALDRELDRKVAIKVLRAGYANDPEAVARIQREARLVAKLRHPNIVPLLGSRRLNDGSLAMIMQYVPGRTLKDAIRERGPVPPNIARRILEDVGSALDYAHRRHGLVHRDIKPGNIYLDADYSGALLSDFGIARTAGGQADITVAGATLGTPAYMSPEQVDGGDLDGRSDLYSLGLVAYEMLTGEPPWAGHTLYNIIYKQKHEELPPLGEVRPEVPADLLDAIEGLLHKDPDARWPDAATFVREIWDPRTEVDDESWAASQVSAEDGPGSSGEAPTVRLPPGEEPSVAPAAPGSPDLFDDPKQEAPDDARPLSAALAAVSSGVAADSPGDAPPNAVPSPGETPPPGGTAPEGASLGIPSWMESTRPDPAPKRRARGRRGWILLAAVLLIGASAATLTTFTGEGGAGNAEFVGSSGADDPAATQPTGDGGASRSALDALPPMDGSAASTPPTPDAGPPAHLFPVEGGLQVAPAGEPLPRSLLVRVEDEEGRPVAGAQIAFEVASGDGEVEPASAQTDASGTAEAAFTLGPAVGEQLVVARLPGTDLQPLEFSVMALDRGASQMVMLATETLEAEPGEVLSDGVAVRVEDDLGNPVEGAEVLFGPVGGGSADPATTVTGPDGIAGTEWTLSPEPGEQTLLAELPLAGLRTELTAWAGGETTTASADSTELVEPAPSSDSTDPVASAGSAVSAGGNADAGTPVNVAARSVTLVAGGTHTCRLSAGGEARCWGGNASGQVGNETGDSSPTPVSAPAPEAFAAVAAGVSHTCALDRDGRAWCWGENGRGQLGDGSRETRSAPRRVQTENTFVSITAGLAHTCAVTASGAAVCWGGNESGALGEGNTGDRSSPAFVAGSLDFASLAAGWTHTCGLGAGGEAYCWGGNASGQVGDGTTMDRRTPTRVAEGYTFRAIATGAAHTCGATRDGEVLCWGGIGGAGTAGGPSPTPVEATERLVAITAGASHACALSDEGEAFCWGSNRYGQLGDGTTDEASVPVRVDGGLRFTEIDAKGSHTCGLATNGLEYCWGYNIEGQLGDGTRTHRTAPVRVSVL